MEELQSTLRSIAFRQLSSLQDKVERDLKVQNAINEKTRNIKELETRVLELLKKKSDLQHRLALLSTETFGSKLLRICCAKTANDERKEANTQRFDAVHEVLAHGLERDECRRLKGLLRAHVFTGITFSALRKPERVAINFGTAYKDNFLDTFILELSFEGTLKKVFSSTLPSFVPVSSLLEKHNCGEMELTHVMLEVHSYLLSYVERRQQIAEMNMEFGKYLIEEVSSCSPHSSVGLIVGIPLEDAEVVPLSLHLVYKDLCSSQPTKVQCSSTDKLPIERRQLKCWFKTVPISEAFHYLLDQVTMSATARTNSATT
ncbi:hypothetical protein EMCRGX_G024113 [Ephydatia muelleri]|eukprot:Em0015g343a